MKKPYVPQVEGNDQGRRAVRISRRYDSVEEVIAALKRDEFEEADDWDAAVVAEEGKSGTMVMGMVITAVIVAVAGWAVLG